MAAQDFGDSDFVGWGAVFMLDSFPVLLAVGSILGFLAGLGVGGGSLLMLWLTLVMGVSHPDARNINLLFFIPGAVISSVFRWKQGALDIKKILPAVLLGCISAGVFSLLGKYLDAGIFKKLFGVLLLLTGLREVFYRPRKAK